MKEEKLGQEPAFPVADTINPYTNDVTVPMTAGISKRFYAACAAMTGLIAGVRGSGYSLNIKEIIEVSYNFADELLKQENT